MASTRRGYLAGAASRRRLARSSSSAQDSGASDYILSLQSWFFKPEFGMEDYEILGRASGVSTLRHDGAPVVLTSLHNVDPAQLPHYCGSEDSPTAWMHHVKPEEVKCIVQVLNKTGQVLDELPLKKHSMIRHEFRDLAALEFDDNNLALSFLEKYGLGPIDFEKDKYVQPGPDMKVICFGHRVEAKLENNQDVSQSFPCIVPGSVAAFEMLPSACQGGNVMEIPQILVLTESVLESGMCGGPVRNEHGQLIGMVEGVLTVELAEELETPQLAALIPASELALFTASLEAPFV
eukprot:CAMPEP_0171564366 /NCGR_PEP_ID=MMETSP0960-20121227/16239_1 /TAXON_ID=87120 /ORGANISM="Aurantiochytrium limacinum, Strain ATCCMYA-1381" /LENGTH=292 /DNA_ID=CAMNT_0012117723 /DNA_START=104 /DNA_END=982 /DNA_ORIENTATION=-